MQILHLLLKSFIASENLRDLILQLIIRPVEFVDQPSRVKNRIEMALQLSELLLACTHSTLQLLQCLLELLELFHEILAWRLGSPVIQRFGQSLLVAPDALQLTEDLITIFADLELRMLEEM